jgi:RHS repeat-associated protein
MYKVYILYSSIVEAAIPMASYYRYDQMNRLKKVQSFSQLQTNATTGVVSWNPTVDDRYQMQLSYDLNGNILSLKRNGNKSANDIKMDEFTYNYYSLNGTTQQDVQLLGFDGTNTTLATNRLSKLVENTSFAANYSDDIDGNASTGIINYNYDALGNLTKDLSEEIDQIKWNAYGKVVEVIRTTNNHNKPDLAFEYDAFGQRIKKIVKPRAAGQLAQEKNWQETYYVRDAQGNVMAMYQHASSYTTATNHVTESLNVTEWDLYGSSRLGIRKPDANYEITTLASREYDWVSSTISNEVINPAPTANFRKFRLLGAKTFELTNHLGNVITTISDRKLMVEDPANTGYIHYFKPEILSISEQYAFGMSMPGRTYSVEDYRFGFNGKENQDDLLGEDNAQDFGARMYDARLGRWWGLDPLISKYPSISPYTFCADNPLLFVDKDGRDYELFIDHNSKKVLIKADFYVNNGNDESVANEGIKIWLALNGCYQYQFGKDGEMESYDIEFQLHVNCTDNDNLIKYEKIDKGLDSRIIYPIANTFRVTDEQKYYNNKPNAVGSLKASRIVSVKQDFALFPDIAGHEIGHALGLNHFTSGLMKDVEDRKNNLPGLAEIRGIFNNNKIIKRSFFEAGKYQLLPLEINGIGTVKNIGIIPKNFNNGKVRPSNTGKARSPKTLDYEK